MTEVKYIAVHLLNDFSGSPRVLADFCSVNHIQSRSLTIVTNGGEGFLKQGLGDINKIWYPKVGHKLLALCLYFFAQVQLFFIVIWLCRKNHFGKTKHVVINNTVLSLSSMIASRLMGALTIVYIHEFLTKNALIKKVSELVIRFAADEVLLVSNILLTRYQLGGCHTTILPNGLRSDFITTSQPDYDSKFHLGQILFVGSARIHKGIDELIKIAGRLPKLRFEAVLNFSDRELTLFMNRKTLPENLELFAQNYDLQKKYQSAFLLLNLSIPDQCVETFSLTILEGMSAACPCIVPPTGGHLEYFDIDAGLSIDSRQTDKIVDFICRLQNDRALWQRCAHSAFLAAQPLSSKVYFDRVDAFLIEASQRKWRDETFRSKK